MSTETKQTAHADAGRTRLRKIFVEKPDTVIKLPEGRTMTLWAVWKLPPCREGMIRSHPLSDGRTQLRVGWEGADSAAEGGMGSSGACPLGSGSESYVRERERDSNIGEIRGQGGG